MGPETGFDLGRYRKLLFEATDEPKRLGLIDLLIKERAKERLEAAIIAEALGTSGQVSLE
jgi:hypothetical protein